MQEVYKENKTAFIIDTINKKRIIAPDTLMICPFNLGLIEKTGKPPIIAADNGLSLCTAQ